jgi:hypothetical protein
MDYKEQIKHPKWQKKRLEILERDNFTCCDCTSCEKTLNVHHLKYEKNRFIWDYHNDDLITLCQDCHKSIHDYKKELDILFTRFWDSDCRNYIFKILNIISGYDPYKLMRTFEIIEVLNKILNTDNQLFNK